MSGSLDDLPALGEDQKIAPEFRRYLLMQALSAPTPSSQQNPNPWGAAMSGMANGMAQGQKMAMMAKMGGGMGGIGWLERMFKGGAEPTYPSRTYDPLGGV